MRQLYYMITIRSHNTKLHISEQMLTNILEYVTRHDNLYVIDQDCELDPVYKQLHLHGVVHSTRLLVYKQLITSLGGYRIYYQHIGSLPGAISYIHKNEFECHKVINEYGRSSYFKAGDAS